MKGQITADGSTQFITVKGRTHISLSGSFGGGTVALEQASEGGAIAVLDSGVAITYTAAADDYINFGEGDSIRFTTSSSTTPTIRYSVS